jgi:hypothetical protein
MDRPAGTTWEDAASIAVAWDILVLSVDHTDARNAGSIPMRLRSLTKVEPWKAFPWLGSI